MTDPGWEAAWRPLVDRIGSDLDEPGVRFGPDPVEAGAIRRWLEPLEFDCALHRDAEAARAHGWPDVIAPYTAMWTFVLPAVWEPGERPTFEDGSRDAQPWRSVISDDVFPGAPPTSGMFGTGISIEFERPLHVGERAGSGPRRLLDCVPKETRVGRGAFVTFDRQMFADGGSGGGPEPICRVEAQLYLYDPAPGADHG
ncbi:MaoC family dehydratase N-terminal domain-containing protein [Spirillospora sp. NPDC047279]|uniref:FAS1-like dehydratase domain-containing protein n=1 Tax=Spirillospora sp. NPDC047279 TaxID=3155478 RepID=UPI0033DEE59C